MNFIDFFLLYQNSSANKSLNLNNKGVIYCFLEHLEISLIKGNLIFCTPNLNFPIDQK